jgi:L-amino acid N-acyltransferase YncA
MQIRDATESDFGQITEIYNDIVLHSTATWNDRPATVEERIAWWQGRMRQCYPVLVAADQDRIAGFATFGDFRSWPGYRFTVEGTIHIRDGVRGKGIGTALLNELTARARTCNKHVMIAGVDSTNAASIAFLTRFGFTSAGTLHQVGFKFNRWLDLHFLEYRL